MKFLVLFVFLITIPISHALTLKVGVLAPDGTSWAINLKKMAKEIKSATKGKVKLKTYLGGALGDEIDVLRKIRIGQVHGGIFTGKTLGDINGDVRILEVPFTFLHDREKAISILDKLSGDFNKNFKKQKFVNLGFFEIGSVYLVSQKKVSNLDELKGVKIWSWEGDPIVSNMVDVMKLISVPLPLPDVMSSLTTGIIEAAYSSPMGVIALQWNTKIKYLLDFPITFAIGAFLIDMKKWNKISQEHQVLIRKIATKYIKMMNKSTIKENKDALTVMKSMGIEFLTLPEKDIKKGKGLREQILKRLKGSVISKEVIEKVERLLK